MSFDRQSWLARSFEDLWNLVGRQATSPLPAPDGPEYPLAGAEGPRDSVLLIDASPSMLYRDWPPSRLAAAQHSAKVFLDKLAENEPDARVAIVAYGGSAYVACGLTPVTDSTRLKKALKGLFTIDATNITAGLVSANALLAGARATQQVIVLSDGCHNKGRCPRPTAQEIKRHAIIECIGIGSRHQVDEELLGDIASAKPDGSKRYRWIGDPEELNEHYRNLAGGLSRT